MIKGTWDMGILYMYICLSTYMWLSLCLATYLYIYQSIYLSQSFFLIFSVLAVIQLYLILVGEDSGLWTSLGPPGQGE